MTRRIGLLLFDDVEVLDACGPFEVFSVANRVAADKGLEPPFEIILVGAAGTSFATARGGLRLGIDVPVTSAPVVDIVLIPGGIVDVVAAEAEVLTWISGARRDAELVASVCNGAFVLAAAGMLDSRPVTTHWADIDGLRSRWPELDVTENVRWIDHGDIATSAGISAGLDLALHLVDRFVGHDHAVATARLMDYRWQVAAESD